VAFLEDELGDTERRAGGEQVGDDADRRDQRRLQRDQQQQEAESKDDADDHGRLAGELGLEVVVLGGRAADH
jgi:hypothetical protein